MLPTAPGSGETECRMERGAAAEWQHVRPPEFTILYRSCPDALVRDILG
jgi:hypothetical protein